MATSTADSPHRPRSLEEFGNALERIEASLAELREHLECQVEKEFYTVEEVAKRVRRAPWTVRNACRLGRIQAVRAKHRYGVGGPWRIPRAEVARIEREGLPPGEPVARRGRPPSECRATPHGSFQKDIP